MKPKQKKQEWKKILSQSIRSLSELADINEEDREQLGPVISKYPMRINPYYFGLIKRKNDPIYRQCIPNKQELMNEKGLEDPLNEDGYSPLVGITHRYPDRVLFLISSQCAMYCRFCNRKRKVGTEGLVTEESIGKGIGYIQDHREIRDVLLSGGDPLLLENRELDEILSQIRSIPHVEIIRIGTRVPCTLPQRITPELTRTLKKYHPLYIHTQFNHPNEITEESSSACERLADAGLPLGCQTVLLKDINDNPSVMKTLMQKLLTIRVRPYYLFQADHARGTAHFWTPLKKGLEIIKALHGHTSGLCVPHFAVDLSGGGGKILMTPDNIIDNNGSELIIENFMGKTYRYPINPG
ncbi:KamA family radical SAM protein [Thermodesulfobacteriota bacterium]